MLLKMQDLERIKAGEITLVFRRWRKPTVKAGSSLKTAVGMLAIGTVTPTTLAKITVAQAKQAGYPSRPALISELKKREGECYRIQVRYQGADPRLTLREMSQLDEDELKKLRSKLERLDRASRFGPWTIKVLKGIQKQPHQPSALLAEQVGFQKEWLKVQVRKLKNLSLTISHEPGYELSPRGKVVLDYLRRRAGTTA